MKRFAMAFLAIILFFAIAASVNAELIDRGGGLIYDTDLNVTWLQNANPAGMKMCWEDALDWAANFIYYDEVRNKYWDDWRLPKSTPSSNNIPTCYGWRVCGEMGHLYYVELQNTKDNFWNSGPFLNIQSGRYDNYWTGTVAVEYPDGSGPEVYFFFWYNGMTSYRDKMCTSMSEYYAWAVRDGDVGPGPNQAPIANAGIDQTVRTETVVTLDGNASSDPDENYPLTFAWTMTSKPSGSIASLTNANTANPSFVADVPGGYTIQLIVEDSEGLQSAPDDVVVNATLVVGPLFEETQKLLASGGSSSGEFGYSVSVDGNVALVGAQRDNWNGGDTGSVYVYVYNGSSWVEEQKLTASDGNAGDFFGCSVSISGNLALIGAWGDDSYTGSVYVYVYNGSSWVEEQKLTASDGNAGDFFGWSVSVSISGNLALIGAWGDDSYTGSVYVYAYNGSSWVEEQKLTASDGYWSHYFGSSVSIHEDIALIGGHLGTSAGAAYVYRYNGSSWVEEQKLTASDGNAGDFFGWSVSISGNLALIGAWGDDSYTGSAYVFRHNGSSWVEEQKLYAYDGVAHDCFGSSVSMNGDVALVGAHQEITGTGAAYVYRYNGSSWVEDQKLTASDGTAKDLFGFSVSCSGNVALIGASGDYESGIRSGSAYVFSFPNTPSGSDVSVAITDTMTGAEVVVTFGTVIAAGNTTVTTYSSGPELPATFGLGQPPTYFNITTNAEYEPPVTISIDYSGITFSKDESELRLLQETGAGWLDITTSVDTINKIIYGETTGLSFFAVVEPSNEPPVADLGDSYNGFEGAPVTFDGTGSWDPDGDLLDYDWTFGDSNTGAGETYDHTYADNGLYDVCLTVTDPYGLSDTDCTKADIANVAPAVGSISAPVDPVQVSISIAASADFTDPGTADTHTAVWDWGDGKSDTIDLATSPSSASHTYDTPGVYTIELTVTDDDGGAGRSMFQYVVVYDPVGGFVTGGGWINSPAGAYAADPSLTGKANFGFVSKYKKGATVPTGETEFQFKVADLNFHSDSYQWLVVAGAKAMYKGIGTINGAGNYGFMLSAIDEKLTPSNDVDLFRIKIWDKDDSDAVIYDNQMGAADDANPATEIGGGSIVIHNN